MKGTKHMGTLQGLCLVSIVGLVLIPPSLALSEEEILLETLGATTAQGLFLTHMAIGTLVDGYAAKAYDKEKAIQIMDAYIQISQSTKNGLNKLLTSHPLSDEDTRYLRRIISTYDLLIASAHDVKAFINTGNKSHIEAYTKDRDQAWGQISDLLGLK